MKTSKILFAAAVLLAAVTSIQAQVVIGNLAINDLNTSDALSTSSRYAVGFTTGPSALSLQNIKLDLSLASGSALLDIRGPNGTIPSGTAGFSTFNAPTISGTTYTFTPSSTFSLAPSTTYWLVVGASATGVWYGNTPDKAYTTSLGYSYLTTRSSLDGGATWSVFPSGGNPGLAITAVPEPSEYAMLAGFALLGFAVWRRTMAVKAA